MIVVTGGAGFIGSAIATELNNRGITELIIVDILDHPDKQKNLESLNYRKYFDRDDFLENIKSRKLDGITAIFHMGACSSTTETDETFLQKNNVDYSKELALFALEFNFRFIYASSAATYGDGENGYEDDEGQLKILSPLNPYGHSKQNFDLWAQEKGILNEISGLKYFNVYGPNEYHKEDMRSMVLKGYQQAIETGKIRLFKSYKAEYADGCQVRDFLYIKDAVEMTLFFYDNPKINGIFNVGSGHVGSWNDLAFNIFKAQGKEPNIEYIDMPLSIRNQYQYHTCADTKKIGEAGCKIPITSLEQGIQDYVRNYLISNKRLAN
ncbi:MAG: ADP-glyceromanno-heptose 6-epimerase [Nitrospinales bacterium]